MYQLIVLRSFEGIKALLKIGNLVSRDQIQRIRLCYLLHYEIKKELSLYKIKDELCKNNGKYSANNVELKQFYYTNKL